VEVGTVSAKKLPVNNPWFVPTEDAIPTSGAPGTKP
jgi:hypothetical protein